MAGTGPNNDVLGWARVARYLRHAIRNETPGGPAILRSNAYGEQVMAGIGPKPYGISSEGSYFITRTPTPATGINTIAAGSSFADNSPFIIVTNANVIGGPDIHLDYIKLIAQTAGTNGTNLSYASKIDVIPRYSSGGSGGAGTLVTTPLNGPYPTNSAVPGSSSALVYAGALVAVAGSLQQRLIESGPLRSSIMVANDQLIWNFGGQEQVYGDLAIATATAVQRTIPHPPVCIAPGHSFLFHLWAASQTVAAAWEVIIGHVER